MNIDIRQIEPSDRELLARAFDRLSPESRYRRFFSTVSSLSDRQLDYLTEVDHHDHEALIALDPDDGEAVAVARYVRIDEKVAEPAIVVIDDCQGQGVATQLLDALTDRAREEGVECFVAPVLAQNTGAIKLFERLGDASIHRDGTEVELTIPLGDAEGAPPSLRRVLSQVALGGVRPALAFWQRIATSSSPSKETGNAVVVALPADDAAVARVAERAAGVAAAWGAEVRVVAAQRFLLDDRDQLERRLDSLAARLGARGVKVKSRVARGDLAAALIEEAKSSGARLIVTDGSEPHASTPLLGSVWDHVSHHAPCNVLIAR
jgi:RimJ/RimL family protein N-acetyltransferase/nucleotide-binding universal stress UspA family protein